MAWRFAGFALLPLVAAARHPATAGMSLCEERVQGISPDSRSPIGKVWNWNKAIAYSEAPASWFDGLVVQWDFRDPNDGASEVDLGQEHFLRKAPKDWDQKDDQQKYEGLSWCMLFIHTLYPAAKIGKPFVQYSIFHIKIHNKRWEEKQDHCYTYHRWWWKQPEGQPILKSSSTTFLFESLLPVQAEIATPSWEASWMKGVLGPNVWACPGLFETRSTA